MDNKEQEFIRESILNLLKGQDKFDIKSILDYLDYVNKVVYKENEIFPILNKLIVEKKISLNMNLYFLM